LLLSVFIGNNDIMTEANKNSIKHLSIMFLGFGIFVLIAFYVPDDSIFKKIFAYLCTAALVAAIVWFTQLGNPIKRLIRRFKKK
jgi:cell division protein FtsW (lipid II flippase)